MNVAKRSCIAGFVLLSLAASAAHAEALWPPNKTVHIVVPYAAGGPGEIVMRALAQEVTRRTKSNIVVEPRPGGSTIIGTEAVARSSPDGATLLLVANTFIINASLKANLPYDPLTSFRSEGTRLNSSHSRASRMPSSA